MKRFKDISGYFGCGYFVGACLTNIYVVQNIPRLGCAMSISSSEVVTSNRNTSRRCGHQFIIRLWLILGVCVVNVELRGTLPNTWLNPLKGVIAIPGVGSLRVLRQLGGILGRLAGRIIGLIRNS